MAKPRLRLNRGTNSGRRFNGANLDTRIEMPDELRSQLSNKFVPGKSKYELKSDVPITGHLNTGPLNHVNKRTSDTFAFKKFKDLEDQGVTLPISSKVWEDSLKGVKPKPEDIKLGGQPKTQGAPNNVRRSTPEDIKSMIDNRSASISGVEATDSILKATGRGAKTLLDSGVDYFKRDGALKKAGIGVLQSSAVSAAGHAGLAALQGEDPWEAAKTGAVRGALVGTGYQGLKGATFANGKTIRENIGHIGRGMIDSYRVQTVAGQQALTKEGVSRQLETILIQQQNTRNAGGIFGLKQPNQPGGAR